MGVNSNLDCEQRIEMESEYNYTMNIMNKKVDMDKKKRRDIQREKEAFQSTITSFFERTTGIIFR